MKKQLLFNVVGRDDLEGVVFARCSSEEKAKKAMKLCEEQGFEDMLEIIPDNMLIDTIEIDGEEIDL